MSTLDPLEWRDLTAVEISQCHSVTGTVLPGERPLNLTAEGTVLTFRTATSPACPDFSSWQQAHLEELDRLLVQRPRVAVETGEASVGSNEEDEEEYALSLDREARE